MILLDLIKLKLRMPSTLRLVAASSLGVDDKTVGAVRADLVNGAEFPHQKEVVGKDGVKQPNKKIERAGR